MDLGSIDSRPGPRLGMAEHHRVVRLVLLGNRTRDVRKTGHTVYLLRHQSGASLRSGALFFERARAGEPTEPQLAANVRGARRVVRDQHANRSPAAIPRRGA